MNLESLDERTVSLQGRFQQLFATIPQYCYILSPSFFIIEINPAVTSALGYSEAELVGKSFAAHCAPEYLPKLQEIVLHWNAEGEVLNEEIAVLARDGCRRAVRLNMTSIRDLDGTVLGLTVIASESNHHGAAQESEHQMQDPLSAVLDSSMDAVLILDGDRHIISLNSAAEKVFRYSSDEVAGAPVERLMPLLLTNEDGTPIGDRSGGDLLSGVRSTGERFPIKACSSRIRGPETSFVVTVRDLTERNTMLEEIAQLNRAASMGQMAASVAHELAQPLAAILSNAQAAARFANRPSPDLDEIRGALSEIIEDDQRARSFLQNMRAIFQKQKITRSAIDLNRVLHEVSRILRNTALRKCVQIRINPSPQPVVVLGEAIAVQQIVLNLANNGIDALQSCPSKERQLTLTSAQRQQSGTGIIQVEDNGCGIAEENKPRLFSPFFTTKRDGLGLGLSICRSVIESLDGRITLVERQESGTLFEIELPLTASDSANSPE